MRRQEFDCQEPELIDSLLQESKIGHLAFQRGDSVELLPYNFTYSKGELYFHASPKTGLALATGGKIKFLTYDTIAWIPSTWRHPNLACPATTYFRSLTTYSTLCEVHDLKEKARSMELFMKKYQPVEPYSPLSGKQYEGPLKALFVGKAKVVNPILKLKMGQNLTQKHRSNVFKKLQNRAQTGDSQVLQMMRTANPDLQNDPAPGL